MFIVIQKDHPPGEPAVDWSGTGRYQDSYGIKKCVAGSSRGSKRIPNKFESKHIRKYNQATYSFTNEAVKGNYLKQLPNENSVSSLVGIDNCSDQKKD